MNLWVIRYDRPFENIIEQFCTLKILMWNLNLFDSLHDTGAYQKVAFNIKMNILISNMQSWSQFLTTKHTRDYEKNSKWDWNRK